MRAAFERAVRALGGPGLMGLAALLVAAVAMVMAQRWDAQAALLQAEARALRAKARSAEPVAASVSSQQWEAALPESAARQQRLADLLELGIRLGLAGARTEHRLFSAQSLERLRVTMPVTGSYGQVRRFIAAALEHDSALSLDAIKLRRVSPMSPYVDAELQWSLHGRAP